MVHESLDDRETGLGDSLDGAGSGFEPLAFRRDDDVAFLAAFGLYDDLRIAVEKRTGIGFFAEDAVGIAVADADVAAGTGDLKFDWDIGVRNDAAGGVDGANRDGYGVASVAFDLGTVRNEFEPDGLSGGLDLSTDDFLAALPADQKQSAGFIDDFLRQHVDGIDLERAEVLSVEDEGDFLHVRGAEDVDLLSVLVMVVPVRSSLKDGFVEPLRLSDVEGGLRESAKVHAAEITAVRRELVVEGGRFAVVVEPGPDEGAREEAAFQDGFPVLAVSGAPVRGKDIVGGRDVLFAVRDDLAARFESAGSFREQDRDVRILGMEFVDLAVLVVEPDDIQDIARAFLREEAAVHGREDGPRRIFGFDGLDKRAGDLLSADFALQRLFVENAPCNDRRMIAVAADVRPDIFEPVRTGVERTVFIDYEETVLVAEVEDVFARRIMGAAVGVRPHFLELFDAEFLDRGGDGDADARMVLVVADAFELDRLAVDGEPVREIELENTESEIDGLFIIHALFVLERDFELIKHGRIRRPGLRRPDADGIRKPDGLVCRKRREETLGFDLFSIRAEDIDIQHGSKIGGGVVDDVHMPVDIPSVDLDFGVDQDPGFRGDTDRIADDELDIAVDAGPFIPPAFKNGGVDFDRDHVVAPVHQDGRDVHGDGVVSVVVVMVERLVDPERGMRRDAAELKFDAFPLPGCRHEETFAVVSPAAPAVSLLAVFFRIESVLHRPVVRQIDGTEFRVVEFEPGERPDDI